MLTTALALVFVLAPGSVEVIDGDTLRAGDARLRLWGIDAPEAGDPGGARATSTIAAMIEGRALACRDMGLDQFGRVLVRCDLPDGRDLGCALVSAGAARDWPRYSGGRYATC